MIGDVMVMMTVVTTQTKTVAQSISVWKLSSVANMDCAYLANGSVTVLAIAKIIQMKMGAVCFYFYFFTFLLLTSFYSVH